MANEGRAGAWKLIGETTCGLRVLLGGVDRPGSEVFKIEQGKGGEAVVVFAESVPELVALLERKPDDERNEREWVAAYVEAPGNIRRLREVRRMTQAELAVILGVTTNTVARWERGERRPRGQSREKLFNWITESMRRTT